MTASCTEPTSEEGRDKAGVALGTVHELKRGRVMIQKEKKEEKEEEGKSEKEEMKKEEEEGKRRRGRRGKRRKRGRRRGVRGGGGGRPGSGENIAQAKDLRLQKLIGMHWNGRHWTMTTWVKERVCSQGSSTVGKAVMGWESILDQR